MGCNVMYTMRETKEVEIKGIQLKMFTLDRWSILIRWHLSKD